MGKKQIKEIFDYWVEVVKNSGRGPRPALDKKRARAIEIALELHGPEVCRDAIDGVTLSPWHMGENPNNKRYDDISLILRDAEHIERFAELKYDSSGISTDAEAFLEALDK